MCFWQPLVTTAAAALFPVLCSVVPGQRRRMLNEQQTTGMLQFAGLKPADRAGYLEDVVRRNDLGGFNAGVVACLGEGSSRGNIVSSCAGGGGGGRGGC
jgi:hypothetical protein